MNITCKTYWLYLLVNWINTTSPYLVVVALHKILHEKKKSFYKCSSNWKIYKWFYIIYFNWIWMLLGSLFSVFPAIWGHMTLLFLLCYCACYGVVVLMYAFSLGISLEVTTFVTILVTCWWFGGVSKRESVK